MVIVTPDFTVVDIVGVRAEFGELPVALPADPQHLPQHAAAVFVNDVQPNGPAQAGHELTLHRAESQRTDEVQEYDRDGEREEQ